MRLKTLLIIIFACFAIIPMVIYTLYSNTQVKNASVNQFKEYVTQFTKEQTVNMELYFEYLNDRADTLASSDYITSVVSAYANSNTDPLSDEYRAFSGFIDNFSDAGDKIIIVNDKDRVIASTDSSELNGFISLASLNGFDEDHIYISAVNNSGTNANLRFVATRTVTSGGRSAKLILYANSDYATDVINRSFMFLIDPKNNILDTPFNVLKNLTNTTSAEYVAIEEAVNNTSNNFNEGVIIEYSYSNSNKITCIMNLGDTGWKIVSAANREDAYRPFLNASGSNIFAMTALAILFIILSILITISITKPLYSIEDSLMKVRRGNHETRIAVMSNNEYGEMSRAFNDLIDDIVVSEGRYRTIIEMSENIIFEWNFSTNVVFVSNNFNKMFSYRAPSDHFSDSFLMKVRIYPEDEERYRKNLDRLGRSSEPTQNEYRWLNIYGDYIWVLIRTATLKDRDGNPQKVVGSIINIDRAKKSEQLLTERASFDALTSLYNRETLERSVTSEMDLAEIRKSELALIFIDIDDFKIYNDQYSHATGDSVLKFVAKTISQKVNGFGFAGRYGGDEFIVCIRNIEINKPDLIAESILSTLNEGFVCEVANVHLKIMVSMGITIIKDATKSVEEIIGKADDAMYKVKKSGKGAFTYTD